MIQGTSIKAYIDLPVGELQKRLLAALRENPPDMTNQEIARIMVRDASTVSGVNVPLRKQGKVEES